MAAFCIISWGVVPLFKFIIYLASSPRLARTRIRAVAISIFLFLILVGGLGFIPYPNRFRAPGVIEAVEYLQVVNDAPGYVANVLTSSGGQVTEGTPLLKLTDKELEIEIEATQAQRAETLAMRRRALREEKADLAPINKRLESIESKLKDLISQRKDLIVKARQEGIWIAPQVKDMVGSWLQRGSPVGQIVDQRTFLFTAVVSQEEASDLFLGDINKAEVRLHGQGGVNLSVTDYQIIPFKHEKLPSAALGWLAGGEVPVSVSDESGLQAAEPFFQINANIQTEPGVFLLHGRSGKLRLTLNPKPLLLQWAREFRQLLQRRYQI
jgi:putative peptide zinc metalloprotease protein